MGRQETDGGALGGDTLSLSNTVPTALTSLPLVATDLVAEMTSKGKSRDDPAKSTCLWFSNNAYSDKGHNLRPQSLTRWCHECQDHPVHSCKRIIYKICLDPSPVSPSQVM